VFEISKAPVEAALVRAYGVAPDDLTAFRGRLAMLQKGNLFGADQRPGKGHKVTYRPDHLHRLIFCCELAELGVAPRGQLKLVAEFWDSRIRPIFAEAGTIDRLNAAAGDNDIALLLTGVSLMAGAWAGGTVPNINSCPLGKLADNLKLAIRPNSENDPLLPRALVVNLTARLRKFHSLLADAHHLHESADSVSRARNEPDILSASRRRARGQKRAGGRRQGRKH
jgi:hypothetical protein